jgi:predicted ATPase
VLVTSRFVVGVYGEHDVVVAPLALPDPQLLAVERLRDVDAIRLFVERAQAAKADFTLSQANAEAVVGICRRLDGLPLAIELAAARIRHFPPQLLCTRLDRRLAVLTGGARTLAPRQQTLRNTIDWTYQLLSPAEQSLFACLGVFVGGCTVEAAEAVCRGADDRSADTLDALASLVDKRLLRQSEGVGGEARFTMLETIREYSLERLAMIGETETLRRCHAAYYRTIVRPMRGWTMMPEHEAWLPHFEQEHDNLRAALRWSIDQGEIETAARIALALWWCWNTRGYTGEAYRWFEQILARRSALPEPRQAQVLNVAGFLGWLQGDLHRAEELHHESLRLSRSLGDRVESAYALMYLGRLAATRGNYLGAETQHQAALEIFRAIGDDYGLVVALRSLGEILVELGEHERATVLLHESLPINTRFGDKAEIGWTWYYLGRAAEAEDDPAQAEALLQRSLDLFRDIGFLDGQARAAHALGLLAQSHGDYRQAEALYRDSLALLRGSGYNTGIMMVVEAMAGLAVAQDRPRRAARLFGAAEHLRESYSAPPEPCMRARHACHVAAARAQLDQVSWETACSEGQVMPLEQAIRYALEGID